ncbi:MAG TPA: hypothetical protein VMZ24_00375 [Patescibacteria group bacterium]|nr:hypothetical protein [Patescibacteria group bacterium]
MDTNAEYPTPVEEQEKAVPTAYIVGGVLILIVLAIGTLALILYLAANYAPELEAVRDVFIIALAFESCIFGIVLVLMLIMLIRLVNTVEFEIKPILEQTNQTVNTVRGTSTFVSKNVVGPVVKTTSFLVGFRRGVAALFSDPRKNLPD